MEAETINQDVEIEEGEYRDDTTGEIEERMEISEEEVTNEELSEQIDNIF